MKFPGYPATSGEPDWQAVAPVTAPPFTGRCLIARSIYRRADCRDARPYDSFTMQTPNAGISTLPLTWAPVSRSRPGFATATVTAALLWFR